MPNRPEYMAIWLGITQIGGVAALINTNLSGTALAHCILIVEPRQVIVAAELIDAYRQAAAHLDSDLPLWVHGEAAASSHDAPAHRRIDLAVAQLDGAPLGPQEEREVALSQRALCIYTSGTTGMPKAANVGHQRILWWSYWFAGMMDARATDCMYNCLPMYHSIGGVVATGSVLVAGGSVVIKEKFSGRSFWADINRHDCTIFQYIGELCRYLLNAPATGGCQSIGCDYVAATACAPMSGPPSRSASASRRSSNSMRRPRGNFSLYNLEGKPGAIGRVPPFMASSFPAAIVRFDVERGEPARDGEGRCIRAARGEVGEAIGRISADGTKPAHRFEGYTTRADTEKKILRDVFAKGDAWLRTGDLMRQDEAGFYYFVDRVGDTFRWKGENVATLEVAEAIASCPGVLEASVYGVAVQGTEGRAGMAALVVDAAFDLAALRAHLVERLADYARPLFLRISAELEITETFKQKKHNLAKEGFDPAVVTDPLYVDHPRLARYVPLDGALYAQIVTGRLRL
jgi:fatty-acyl-CoA synthase